MTSFNAYQQSPTSHTMFAAGVQNGHAPNHYNSIAIRPRPITSYAEYARNLKRPIYTSDQVHQIYERINLPHQYRHNPSDESLQLARGHDGRHWLRMLHRYHIANVPFENLELHYSLTKTISLDPNELFDKIVTQGTGRGGYCMELNAFFGTLLRTLGFDTMSTGGRVNSASAPSGDIGPQTAYKAWSHMLNIVTFPDGRWMTDVGFGTGGPTQPMALVDGMTWTNVAPNQHARLRWGTIDENENPDAKLWIYERTDTNGGPWIQTYCFPDSVEFLPSDYGAMNFATSTARTSFFTQKVICAKFVLDEPNDEVLGTVVLFDRGAHRRIRGQKEPLATFEEEEERVDVLSHLFGIELSPQQQAGIEGLTSAIPPSVTPKRNGVA